MDESEIKKAADEAEKEAESNRLSKLIWFVLFILLTVYNLKDSGSYVVIKFLLVFLCGFYFSKNLIKQKENAFYSKTLNGVHNELTRENNER